MKDNDFLIGFSNRLKEIKEAKGILHIDELNPDGKHPFTFYSDVTNRYKQIKKLPLFLYDDLSFISNDLVHFTSLLFMLRPFINDATKEEGTYFQSWYDARYLSCASILHSSVYNFWDRIGDILNCFFVTGLPDDGVYMGRVIFNFPVTESTSGNFQEIKKIYIDHVRPVVVDRNEDAHNQSIATSHYYGIILANGEDQKKKTKLKFSLPDLFKEQIGLAYKGFEYAIHLIEEKAQIK